ncbi:methyltransferase domain-containing protein [Chloroflexia bacterium SDU3-3]|nr:methyltransferase domain-containing protein [Chloroflexia bacterium SDU3-3]
MSLSHSPADSPTSAPPDLARMPGHWLLAQLGRRVLRPGGLALTKQMLAALAITPADRVVEFAPGLGVTAQLTLGQRPAAYTAIERDSAAAAQVRSFLTRPGDRCQIGTAQETGLPDGEATVVYGEAMLTMHSPSQKAEIIREAARILQPGGRYGIHELCLTPDSIDEKSKQAISRQISSAIQVGARPLTSAEWRELLEAEGFTVEFSAHAPMHLLRIRRMIADEGLRQTIKIIVNMIRRPAARRRMLAMRRVFEQYSPNLAAISLVARKTEGANR